MRKQKERPSVSDLAERGYLDGGSLSRTCLRERIRRKWPLTSEGTFVVVCILTVVVAAICAAL